MPHLVKYGRDAGAGHADGDPAGPTITEGTSEGTWAIVKGEDGRAYLYNSKTGEYKDAPPWAQKQEPGIPIPVEAPAWEDTPLDPRVTGYSPKRNVGIGSGEFGQYLGIDPALYQTAFAMHEAGLLTDSAFQKMVGIGISSGGGGGSSGPTAYQLEQQQYDRGRDRIGDAINILNQLGNMQQLSDQRSAAQRQNQLDAAGWAVDPSQTHFNGLGPDSYLVRMGLADPLAIQHTQFNTALDPNPYDQQVGDALAQLRSMTGVAAAPPPMSQEDAWKAAYAAYHPGG
jgi:hypothetical protein